MVYSRLFAGMSFLAFVFALGGTLRLAVADSACLSPMTSGNARCFEDLAAKVPPASSRRALRTAVWLNPRDSAAWMALGLAAERDGDMDQAADSFLQAEKVDHQYLPAWTSANFFFRRANELQFWRAATQAAVMSYDDPSPLIELTDHSEPNAIAAIERLGDTARLKRGYLRFLIGQKRWREAETVAARLCLRDTSSNDAGNDASDRELLLNFIDRLIDAKEGEAALAVWNGFNESPAREAARHNFLVNPNIRSRPSGHGFDWRLTESPCGTVHWEPSKLEFSLAESIPDACTLLEQWVVLDPGRYGLRFEYATEGLAEETGLRWTLLDGGREEASSATWAQASNRNVAEWNFRVTRAGLYRLAWVYSRVPGTTHQQGRADLAFANLEVR